MSIRNNNEESSRRYPDYFFNICNISNEDLFQQSYSLSRSSCLFVYGESYEDLLASLCHFTVSNKPIVIFCRDEIVLEDTFNIPFFHNKLFLMYQSANVIIFFEERPNSRRGIYNYLQSQPNVAIDNNDNSFLMVPEYKIYVHEISNDFIFQPMELGRASDVLVFGKSYDDLLVSLRQYAMSNKPVVILRGDNIVSQDTDDTTYFEEESFLMYKSANCIIISEIIHGDENLSETRRAIYDYLRYQ